jgi:hypothetical protein
VFVLVDPPVAQPAVLTLDFDINVLGGSIDKVSWTVYSTSGLGNTQRAKIATLAGKTAPIQLPPPAAPNTEYLVECSADLTLPIDGKVTVNIDAASNGFVHSQAIGWVGQVLTAHFRFQVDLINDPATGALVRYAYIKFTGTT